MGVRVWSFSTINLSINHFHSRYPEPSFGSALGTDVKYLRAGAGKVWHAGPQPHLLFYLWSLAAFLLQLQILELVTKYGLQNLKYLLYLP